MAVRVEASKDRFEQIRTATLRAFYRNGYHGTSLRDIAREVGIKVPSLYNYISSKQELLFQLMSSVMEDLTSQTSTAIAASGPHPEQQLRAAIRAFVLFNINHPHEAAVSDAEFKVLTARNRRRMIRLRDRFEANFSRLIDENVNSGVFDVTDVSIVKNTVLSACARIYFWYRHDGNRGPDEVADIVSAQLIEGLRRRATPVTRGVPGDRRVEK